MSKVNYSIIQLKRQKYKKQDKRMPIIDMQWLNTCLDLIMKGALQY